MLDEYEARLTDLEATREQLNGYCARLEASLEELQFSRDQLSRSRYHYKNLYDQASTPLVTITRDDYSIIDMNLTATNLLRCPRYQLLGKRFTAYVRPQSQDAFHHCVRRAVAQESKNECDIGMKYHSGGSFWGIVEVYPVPGSEYLSVSVTDITARKLAEEAVRQSEEQLRRAIEEAPIPTIMLDESGRVLQLSRSWAELTGYDRDEMATFDAWLDRACAESAETVREHVRRLFKGETSSFHLEFPILTRDDEQRWWSFSASSPGTLRTGERFVIGMGEDVTERKHNEALKDEFLSLVSHELRTPLTIISGSLNVALNEAIGPEEGREMLLTAAENAQVLADILENMMEMTRHQAGRLMMNLRLTDLRAPVRKIIQHLKDGGARQTFTVSITEDVPPVPMDPLRIERVLHNLLENAVKYSPPDGRITVTGRLENDRLVVEISDEGPGISRADQKKLFQLFSRVGDTVSISGTGLGLVVCKRLVEAHGGQIEVHSIKGHGATFLFWLPLHPPEPAGS